MLNGINRTGLALLSSAALLGALYGCGTENKGGQDDERYADLELTSAQTQEAYNGSDKELPEGYVTAYDTQSEQCEVHMFKVGEVIDIDGGHYTVETPSKIHASATVEGYDSFLVDLVIEGDDEHPTGSRAACGYFVYSPSGLYSMDLREMAANEHLDDEGDEETDVIDEQLEEPLSYTKTFEIPYDGDGTYTLEIRNFLTSDVYRVPLEIHLDA